MSFSYRKVNSIDVEILRLISIQTFRETYADFNSPENMDLYVSNDLGQEKLMKELASPDSHFYFLLVENEIAGFLKLVKHSKTHTITERKGIEIARLYVLKKFQRMGAGKYLLQLADLCANAIGANHLWLGVWENNKNAIAFYKNNGFFVSGEQYFKLGNDLQRDLIMIKNNE